MPSSPSWSLLAESSALSIPLAFLSAALLPLRVDPLRRAALAAGVALALAVLAALGLALAVTGGAVEPLEFREFAPAFGGRLDRLAVVMLLLVTTIALVIERYSRAYLAGDPGRERYARWLSATLASVTLLFLSDHLLVLAAAWMGTSLGLHQLLTFYEDRTPALVAAHKKFLVSRLADVFLLGGIGLVHSAVGRADLTGLDAFLARNEELPTSLEVAAVLFVVAASLKSAQLPFHGWLTQVMEAPTPVSALLHAGIVNLGGFLMIRLSPLLVRAEVASTLLVLVGTMTAVVAALVMTTRVSIKVALAWSTIAQMGLMLLECGLGAFHLALLHLVAHSFYKAHAFLSAGSVVEAHRSGFGAAGRERAQLGFGASVASLALLGVVLATVAGAALHGLPIELDQDDAPFVLLLAFSLLAFPTRSRVGGPRPVLSLVLRGCGVAFLFGLGHAVAESGFGHAGEGATSLSWALALAGFTTLFIVETVLRAAPESRIARSFHPLLFAGLYLDELFTRWTFRLWPPRLPERTTPHHSLHTAETLEA